MKRSVAVTAILVGIVLAGCGSPKTPFAAEDCIGMNYEEAVEKLEDAGFKNINTSEIEDLLSSDDLDDGDVGAISIDGNSDFQEKAEFKKDAVVEIEYHTLKKAQIPIGIGDLQNHGIDELAKLFGEAGFISVETKEVKDVTPEEKEYIDVSIDGVSDFEKGEDIPIDSLVVITEHKYFQTYTAVIKIDFVSNWFFSKYDVEFLVDGEEQETIEHGTDKEYELKLKEGKHTLAFEKAEDSTIHNEVELDVTADLEVSYEISCDNEEIKVVEHYVDRNEKLADDQVKILCDKTEFIYGNYQEVISTLKEWGFTNIKEQPLYDIELGITDEGEVKSVTIAGADDYNRGDVVAKTSEIVVTYHLNADDDPAKIKPPYDSDAIEGMDLKEVEKAFEEKGFTKVSSEVYEGYTSSDKVVNTIAKVEIDGHSYFKSTNGFYPDKEVKIYYYTEKQETEKREDGDQSVVYSSNDKSSVKNGDSGIYAYKKRGNAYDQYYIINFDEGCVYYFMDGDGNTSGERLQIESGNLNNVVIVTYHDGDTTWQNGLHFKYKNTPDLLIMQDNDGFETEFLPTDLSAALEKLAEKDITDY